MAHRAAWTLRPVLFGPLRGALLSAHPTGTRCGVAMSRKRSAAQHGRRPTSTAITGGSARAAGRQLQMWVGRRRPSEQRWSRGQGLQSWLHTSDPTDENDPAWTVFRLPSTPDSPSSLVVAVRVPLLAAAANQRAAARTARALPLVVKSWPRPIRLAVGHAPCVQQGPRRSRRGHRLWSSLSMFAGVQNRRARTKTTGAGEAGFLMQGGAARTTDLSLQTHRPPTPTAGADGRW